MRGLIHELVIVTESINGNIIKHIGEFIRPARMERVYS